VQQANTNAGSPSAPSLPADHEGHSPRNSPWMGLIPRGGCFPHYPTSSAQHPQLPVLCALPWCRRLVDNFSQTHHLPCTLPAQLLKILEGTHSFHIIVLLSLMALVRRKTPVTASRLHRTERLLRIGGMNTRNHLADTCCVLAPRGLVTV
jgi:hypothetical protein